MIRMDKMGLSVSELAKTLGISKPKAYELTRQDGFPAIRIGEKRIIIPVEGLKVWLNNNSGSITQNSISDKEGQSDE